MLDHLNNLQGMPIYLIIFTGLITGLVGSTHCVGMCGGLVMALSKSKKGNFFYQLGRLIGYLSIGVIVPTIGLNVIGLKDNKTLAMISAVSIGLIFLYIGLKEIFKFKKMFFKHQMLENINGKIWKKLFIHFKERELTRSLLGGLASVFLPCGLLWSVLIISFTATAPLVAAVFVFSFWLGTVPALTMASEIVKKIFSPIKNKMPRMVPIFFIILGISTISYRVHMLYLEKACH